MVRLRRNLFAPLAVAVLLILGLSVFGAEARAQSAARSAELADRGSSQQTFAGLTSQYVQFSLLTLANFAASRSWALTANSATDRRALAQFTASSAFLGAGAAVVDLAGAPLTHVGQLPSPAAPGYRALQGDLMAGRPGISGALPVGGMTLVAFAVPIKRGGRSAGLLLGYADTRHWPLEGYVRRLSLGPGASYAVVDAGGTALASSRRAQLGHQVLARTPAAAVALVGGLVISHHPVADTSWDSLTVQPQRDFFAPLRSTALLELIISALAFTAGLLAVALAAQRRHRQVQRMAQEAIFDPLTGAATRRLLDVRLAAALVRVRRHGLPLAALFIDLDGFKQVNDTHGHHAGDRLLVALSHRFRQAIREEDFLARLGGDEFVVLVADADAAAVAEIASRLLAAASAPAQVGSRSLAVGASIGVAILDPTYTRPEDLLTEADQMMYQAKRAGGRQARTVRLHDDGSRPTPSAPPQPAEASAGETSAGAVDGLATTAGSGRARPPLAAPTDNGVPPRS